MWYTQGVSCQGIAQRQIYHKSMSKVCFTLSSCCALRREWLLPPGGEHGFC